MPMMVIVVTGLFGLFIMETTLLVNTSLLVKLSLWQQVEVLMLAFDTDMQSTAGTDDFLPGERRPNDDSFAQNASSSNSKDSLALSFDDSKYAATDIYLNTKASSGLDVGYDAGTFANQVGSLGLYSFLADGFTLRQSLLYKLCLITSLTLL